MAAPSLRDAIQIGISVLNTVVDKVTGTILALTGDVGTQTTEADNVEWWQTVGLISRPSNPQAGKAAAEGVAIRRGDRDVIIASRDQRGQLLAGSLQPGETVIYAAGGDGKAQGRILLKANGSVALYTAQGNVAGGQSCTIQCNPDGSINLGSPFGGISITQDGIKIAHSSGAAIQLNAAGVTVIGQAVALNGGSVSLGAAASPASPVVWGPAGISGAGSTSVFVSP